MIGCEFLLFGAFLWAFGALSELKFLSKFKFRDKIFTSVKFKYAFVLLLSALCLVPLYKGFCIATLLYSFFDTPSVLCVLLMGFFVLKTLLKDGANFELNLSIKPASFALLFVYSTIIFLGNLDLIPYDFYTPNAKATSDLILYELSKCALVFVLLLALYGVDKLCAMLALISLVPFAFITTQSLLTALICVYLWAFSGVFIILKFFTFLKEKLCKKAFCKGKL